MNSIRKTTKVAGFMLIFSLVVPLLNWLLIFSRITSAPTSATLVRNVMMHEILFRTGIAIELIVSAGVAILALAFYFILKPVNKFIARLGLFWKFTEGIVIAGIAFLNFLSLLIIHGSKYLTLFFPEEIKDLVGMSIKFFTSSYIISMAFLGLGTTLFFYLFYTSRLIPRSISILGIVSFAFIFVFAIMNIMIPEYTTNPMLGNLIQYIFYGPCILTAFVVGLWLLIKGIDVEKWNALTMNDEP